MATLRFENIKIGDQVPSLTRGITQLGMLMYTAATWDFSPMHWDKELVQKRGFPAPFVDGQMFGAYLAEMLMEWVGDSGELRKMDFRFRKMVFAGETVTCKGTVTGKEVKDGEKLVVCDLWIENQAGEKILAPASAVVSFGKER